MMSKTLLAMKQFMITTQDEDLREDELLEKPRLHYYFDKMIEFNVQMMDYQENILRMRKKQNWLDVINLKQFEFRVLDANYQVYTETFDISHAIQLVSSNIAGIQRDEVNKLRFNIDTAELIG